MFGYTAEKSSWEKKNEKSKTNVRWLFLFLVSLYMLYLLDLRGKDVYIAGNDFLNRAYVGTLISVGVFFNLLLSLYLLKMRNSAAPIPAALKYCTMAFDFILVSFVLLPDGGQKSMLFILYFVILVSNGLRYGMRLSIAGVLLFNVGYVTVLIFQYYPEFNIPDIRNEFLKIIGVWIIGIYIGHLARRFELLQGEVERYQKLLRDVQGSGDET